MIKTALIRLTRRVREWLYFWRRPVYQTAYVEETSPDCPEPNTLYVVREDGFEEEAVMVCPCGCQSILHMNLLKDERPCWNLILHKDGTVTLLPSVRRRKGCGSHFWFRKGRVFWC